MTRSHPRAPRPCRQADGRLIGWVRARVRGDRLVRGSSEDELVGAISGLSSGAVAFALLGAALAEGHERRLEGAKLERAGWVLAVAVLHPDVSKITENARKRIQPTEQLFTARSLSF